MCLYVQFKYIKWKRFSLLMIYGIYYALFLLNKSDMRHLDRRYPSAFLLFYICFLPPYFKFITIKFISNC